MDALPDAPGVYLWKDAAGEVLYVGKANSLKSRVRWYFGDEAAASPRLALLAEKIAGLETIVVQSPSQALLLENNLIKEYRPRFNVNLRDDKRYPWLAVTVREPFPRILVTRKDADDGARYFGPYTDVGAAPDAADHPAHFHRALVPLRAAGGRAGPAVPRLPHRQVPGAVRRLGDA